MTGTPEGSTESVFMEKPGFEPVTPGLQGIALIHYTTGASGRLFSRSISHRDDHNYRVVGQIIYKSLILNS